VTYMETILVYSGDILLYPRALSAQEWRNRTVAEHACSKM